MAAIGIEFALARAEGHINTAIADFDAKHFDLARQYTWRAMGIVEVIAEYRQRHNMPQPLESRFATLETACYQLDATLNHEQR